MLDLGEVIRDAKRGGRYDETVAFEIRSTLEDLLEPLRQIMAIYFDKSWEHKFVIVTFPVSLGNDTDASLSVSWADKPNGSGLKLVIKTNLTGSEQVNICLINDISEARASIGRALGSQKDQFRRLVSQVIHEAPAF